LLLSFFKILEIQNVFKKSKPIKNKKYAFFFSSFFSIYFFKIVKKEFFKKKLYHRLGFA
jgi:hypothetical protein